jgi:hypothetical protein
VLVGCFAGAKVPEVRCICLYLPYISPASPLHLAKVPEVRWLGLGLG